MMYAIPETNIAINIYEVTSISIPKDTPTSVEFVMRNNIKYLVDYDDQDCALSVFDSFTEYCEEI